MEGLGLRRDASRALGCEPVMTNNRLENPGSRSVPFVTARSLRNKGHVVDLQEFRHLWLPTRFHEADMLRMNVVRLVVLLRGEFHREAELEFVLLAHLTQPLEVSNCWN